MNYGKIILLIFSVFGLPKAMTSESSTYLGSREGDPASLVENVSTIHGDYTEVEFVPYFDVPGQITYRDQLTLLEPHKDELLFDHDFDSPTFQKTIKDRISNYLMQYGDIK